MRASSSVSETVPENYKWSIRLATGGYIIQHKTSGLYLSGVSSDSNPSSVCLYALASPGTDAYKKQVWRTTHEEDYVELGDDASFHNMDIEVGEAQNASINKSPGSTSWASYTDFDYIIDSGSQHVSYNASTKKFTGVTPGTAAITATHKVTGISRSFSIAVSRMPNADAQNKTRWCWAACSKMVGEHNGQSGALNTGATVLTIQSDVHSYYSKVFYGENSNSQRTVDSGQHQIVVYIHGNDDNHAGYSQDVEDALQLASLNTMTIGTWGNGSLSTAQINSMNNELANGRWVVGDIYASIGRTGHAIVIKSYDATTERYTFWDPWTDSEGHFSRTELLNNTINIDSNNFDYTLVCVQYCQ